MAKKAEKFDYQFYSTTKTAWDAMYQAILSAQTSVYWELYMLDDKADGQRFVDLLCEKASAGVEVKLLLDSVGSMNLSKTAQNKLVNSGVGLLWFHPFSLWRDWSGYWRRLWQRNHRKVLIVDENIAFVGGVNVSNASAEWNDLHVRLTGRVVRTLLRDFAKSYVRSSGDKQAVRHLLHPKLEMLSDWRQRVRFIFSSPYHYSQSRIKDFYYRALRTARESVTLVTPYYLPDKKFLRLLAQAARRGVKVEIILPERSDVRLVHRLAQLYYDVSARAGARLYFSKKMNHGKAILVDNEYGLVGSANITRISFSGNEEAGVYFNEADMVKDLNSILDNWKKESIVAVLPPLVRGKFFKWKQYWADKIRKLI